MRNHFWYLEISDELGEMDEEGDEAGLDPVATALKKLRERLGFRGKSSPDRVVNFSIPSAKPFELDRVSEYLEQDCEGWEDGPIIVLGTCSKKRAVEHSWEQLGLNLFDLPWFESEKAFCYVNVSALWENTAGRRTLAPGDGEASQEDLEENGGPQINFKKARCQLRWAYCHRFAREVQKFVGHGNRDRFQKRSAESVAGELKRKYKDWRGESATHEIDNCPVCRRLADQIDDLTPKDDSEEEDESNGVFNEEDKRAIADLDSHLHKLAPAIHFSKSQSNEDAALGFRCVVLLEDDPDVRRELRKTLRKILLPSSNEGSADESSELVRWHTSRPAARSGDANGSRYLYQRGENLLYVVEVDNEESTQRHRLCDEGGEDILDNLIRSEIPIVHEAKESTPDSGGTGVYFRTIEEGGDEDEDDWDEAEEDQLQDLVEQDSTLQRNDILTCFDLDLEADGGELSDTLYRGLWAMYGTACDYPYIPRMVVTGYRSQTALSHGAGAHAYLMKPFTNDRLHDALRRAQDVRRVTWICPEGVKDNYDALVSSLDEDSDEEDCSSAPGGCSDNEEEERPSFKAVKELLRHRLRQKRVSLNVEEAVPDRECLADSDLVVLDPFTVQMPGLRDNELQKGNTGGENAGSGDSEQDDPLDFREDIGDLRSLDEDVPLLLVLPADGNSNSDGDAPDTSNGDRWKPENIVAEFFHGTSLRLREGQDAIARKPTWLSADGHPDPEAGLANQIFSLLDNENRFDVKYQVLVPVAAVLGRFGERIRDICQEMHDDEEPQDRVFSPLLPFLVQAFGLSASVRDLCEIESAELAGSLRSQVRRDQRQNTDDWSHVDQETIDEVLDCFAASGIRHPSIRKHVTLENWMRKMVDRRAREAYDHPEAEERAGGGKMGDVTTLTRPLSLLFGGSTRYEFSARGSWYKSTKERVDDILIVVEFCARSSIVARQIIKDLAVHYLSKVAGEEAVMVQEVSTDARIWSDS